MKFVTFVTFTVLASSAALAQTTPPVQDPHTMSTSDIQRIQGALVNAGYLTTVDGVWNDQSAAALNAFKTNRALPNTNGGVDHSVMSALGLNKPE